MIQQVKVLRRREEWHRYRAAVVRQRLAQASDWAERLSLWATAREAEQAARVIALALAHRQHH